MPVNASSNLISWLSQLNANDEFELSDLSKALRIWWQVWNDKNNLVLCDCKANHARVPMVADVVGKQYHLTNKNLRSIHTLNATHVHDSSQTIKWRPPHAPKLKINFDGSVVVSTAAAGFVIRDANSSPIVAGYPQSWRKYNFGC
ncbi:hypothetical protein ACFX13_038586 [Malus domestica]